MKHHRVKPNTRVTLHDSDAQHTGDCKSKADAATHAKDLSQKLDTLQERLYVEGKRGLLVILQGMDTSGKDGAIRHLLGGLNHLGCRVTSFKVPTPLEKAHNFLWRIHAACPPRGHIAIFNRSQYEDVLITRVHEWISKEETMHRMQQIRDFEKMLTENGTRILKFFLHISKAEQKERLLARIDNVEKRWKFSPQDLKERKFWKSYQRAYEDALSSTSTKDSPWYVVPSDHKWYRNLVISEAVVHALEDMDPCAPKRSELNWKKLRRNLASET